MIQQKQKRGREGRFGLSKKPADYDQKIIDIRRVARVVAGGRRFNFRVAIVIGNRKGEVGVGLGKADDTTSAIEKAFRNAKKNLIKVFLTENSSIPHETEGKLYATLLPELEQTFESLTGFPSEKLRQAITEREKSL